METKDTDTFFNTRNTQFPKIINSKIKTRELLDAAMNLIDLLDTLGKAFAPARYDMNGNIEKITKRYSENPVKNEYLEDMLLAEKAEGKLLATDALMWLRRGLHFMLEFFEGIINDTSGKEDMSGLVKAAYVSTLKRYHGWLGSNLFNILSRLVPYRKTLFAHIALEKENCDEYVLRDLKEFTMNLRRCVEHLIEFYTLHGLESETKV